MAELRISELRLVSEREMQRDQTLNTVVRGHVHPAFICAKFTKCVSQKMEMENLRAQRIVHCQILFRVTLVCRCHSHLSCVVVSMVVSLQGVSGLAVGRNQRQTTESPHLRSGSRSPKRQDSTGTCKDVNCLHRPRSLSHLSHQRQRSYWLRQSAFRRQATCRMSPRPEVRLRFCANNFRVLAAQRHRLDHRSGTFTRIWRPRLTLPRLFFPSLPSDPDMFLPVAC